MYGHLNRWKICRHRAFIFPVHGKENAVACLAKSGIHPYHGKDDFHVVPCQIFSKPIF
jgi:hypothetical protein